METRELARKVEQAFGKSVLATGDANSFPFIQISTASLKEVLAYCSSDALMKLDFLDCLTVVDTGQDIVATYHLFSTTLVHKLNIRVSVGRQAPRLPSVTRLWKAAVAYEREAAEMFGIAFDGHPSLRPLLLPEGWIGHPLRKDYVFPEEYQGIEHRRAPLRKEHARP